MVRATVHHPCWLKLESISEFELAWRVRNLVSTPYVLELSVGLGQTPFLIILEELDVEVYMIEILLLQFGDSGRIPLLPLLMLHFQTFF